MLTLFEDEYRVSDVVWFLVCVSVLYIIYDDIKNVYYVVNGG